MTCYISDLISISLIIYDNSYHYLYKHMRMAVNGTCTYLLTHTHAQGVKHQLCLSSLKSPQLVCVMSKSKLVKTRSSVLQIVWHGP